MRPNPTMILPRRWSLKGEALYYQLGNDTLNGSPVVAAAPGAAIALHAVGRNRLLKMTSCIQILAGGVSASAHATPGRLLLSRIVLRGSHDFASFRAEIGGEQRFIAPNTHPPTRSASASGVARAPQPPPRLHQMWLVERRGEAGQDAVDRAAKTAVNKMA